MMMAWLRLTAQLLVRGAAFIFRPNALQRAAARSPRRLAKRPPRRRTFEY